MCIATNATKKNQSYCYNFFIDSNVSLLILIANIVSGWSDKQAYYF
jgi:hypothetical protein